MGKHGSQRVEQDRGGWPGVRAMSGHLSEDRNWKFSVLLPSTVTIGKDFVYF